MLEQTAVIVAAFLQKNTIDREELGDLIREVRKALSDDEEILPDPEETIFEDYLICLEDGKKLKMLKRYLMTQYNLTPEAYKEKWNLPSDYPMVAPSYSRKRSEIAKENKLGQPDSAVGD